MRTDGGTTQSASSTCNRQINTYPKHFILMPVKHMCHETAMRPERLSRHHVHHALLLLRHIANMIAVGIHDDVLVGLFKTNHHIHELQLPLHHQT